MQQVVGKKTAAHEKSLDSTQRDKFAELFDQSPTTKPAQSPSSRSSFSFHAQSVNVDENVSPNMGCLSLGQSPVKAKPVTASAKALIPSLPASAVQGATPGQTTMQPPMHDVAQTVVETGLGSRKRRATWGSHVPLQPSHIAPQYEPAVHFEPEAEQVHHLRSQRNRQDAHHHKGMSAMLSSSRSIKQIMSQTVIGHASNLPAAKQMLHTWLWCRLMLR